MDLLRADSYFGKNTSRYCFHNANYQKETQKTIPLLQGLAKVRDAGRYG